MIADIDFLDLAYIVFTQLVKIFEEKLWLVVLNYIYSSNNMQEYTSTSVDIYFWIVYFLLLTFLRLNMKMSVYQDKIQSKI